MNARQKMLWFGSVSLLAGIILTVLRAGQPISATEAPHAALRAEHQSLCSVLFTLAAERYAANEKRGETWILAVHDWANDTNVVRYSNGRYDLISIPVFESDVIGFRQYVSAYNSFNLRAADLMAAAGEYKGAAEMYQILLQAERRNTPRAGELKQRLAYLNRLAQGEDVKPALEELLQEYKGLGAFPKLAEVWAARPIAVTNWQTVTLP